MVVLAVVETLVKEDAMAHATGNVREHAKVLVKAHAKTAVLATVEAILMLNFFSTIFSIFNDLRRQFNCRYFLYLNSWGNDKFELENISNEKIIIKKAIAPQSITLLTIINDCLIEPNHSIFIKFENYKGGYNNFKILLKCNDLSNNYYVLINNIKNKKPSIDLNIWHIFKFKLIKK